MGPREDTSPPKTLGWKAVGVTTHMSANFFFIVHTVHRPCLLHCTPPWNSMLGPLVISPLVSREMTLLSGLSTFRAGFSYGVGRVDSL